MILYATATIFTMFVCLVILEFIDNTRMYGAEEWSLTICFIVLISLVWPVTLVTIALGAVGFALKGLARRVSDKIRGER